MKRKGKCRSDTNTKTKSLRWRANEQKERNSLYLCTQVWNIMYDTFCMIHYVWYIMYDTCQHNIQHTEWSISNRISLKNLCFSTYLGQQWRIQISIFLLLYHTFAHNNEMTGKLEGTTKNVKRQNKENNRKKQINNDHLTSLALNGWWG